MTAAGGLVLASRINGDVQAVHVDGSGWAWRRQFDGELLYAPTVGDGRVYLRSASEDVLALSLADGSLLWRRSLAAYDPGPITDPSRFGSPPLLHGDWVYFGTDAGVERVSADGERRELVHETEGSLQQPMTVAGDTLYGYVPSSGGFAVSLPDGDRLWTAEVVDGPPVPGREHLFGVAGERTLRAYRSSA